MTKLNEKNEEVLTDEEVQELLSKFPKQEKKTTNNPKQEKQIKKKLKEIEKVVDKKN